jgi:hypothetical protein
MKWLRNKKRRMLLSLGTAALLCIFLSGEMATGTERILPETEVFFASSPAGTSPCLAWWGTLYPQFCFSEIQGEADDTKTAEKNTTSAPKMTFWLAKVLRGML